MPTVPEYPEEDWMTQLGMASGSRQRWQMAMMEPKKAIPISPTEEAEKIVTGAAAGPGKGKPSPMGEMEKYPPAPYEPMSKQEKFAKPGPIEPFSKEEYAAGKWVAENILKSKQPSMHEIASKGVQNIYKVADEYEAKWSQSGKSPELQPVNWQELQNRYMKVDLPEQAKQLGFSEKYPIYKGGARTEAKGPLKDPAGKGFERGLFFAEDPDIAQAYTAKSYIKPIEYVAAPKNPATVDLRGKAYDSDTMHSVVETARQKGHDLVVVKNVLDVGSGKPQNQIVVTDPSIVRSPKAKFDPNAHHINDVLATLLATAGVGKAVKELNPDKNQ